MKKILSLFLTLLFGSQMYAVSVSLPNEKVYVTEEGIFLNMPDGFMPAQSLSYLGNGYYAAEYYGQCGRCGWALDKNGKCTNQNCNQYGPRERD